MVVGDFVPVSSNNTFRALGFAEELPNLGWDPFVLTRNPEQSEWSKDLDLKANCPSVQVAGNALLWRAIKKCSAIMPEVLLADRAQSWIPLAVAKGVRMTFQHRIKVIFGSFQPWSALAAAYLISRITQRPLVAEFRDPVMSVLGETAAVQPRLDLARRIALHASGIVTTTSEISQDILRLSNGRLNVAPLALPHGYRRTDHQAFSVPPLERDFVVTFTGSLYRHPCIDTFCQAVSRFLRLNPQLTGRVRLKVVGRQKEGAFEFLQHCAQAHEILDSFEFLPWQSQESLKEIISLSHMVWCTDTLAGSGEGVIMPGRLAKMFACGRPVLALCRAGGATWRAVRETGTGECFEYGDVLGTQGFISKVHEVAVQAGAMPQRNEAKLSEYSFSTLTTKLSDLLVEAMNRNGKTTSSLQSCSYKAM